MSPRYLTTRTRQVTAALVLLGGLTIAGVGVAAGAEHLGHHHEEDATTQSVTSLEGKVTAVFANTVTVRTEDGPRLVVASPSTTISSDDKAVGPGAITVGSSVEIDGRQGAPGKAFEARHIDVHAEANDTTDR
jgi:Domain of unknown function (DUF5666)